MSDHEWTFDQHIALERMAGRLSVRDLVPELAARGPHHNERAIAIYASKHALSLERLKAPPPIGWDDEQRAILRRCVGRLTAEEIVGEIRRELAWVRTARQIRREAQRLGLSLWLEALRMRDVASTLHVTERTVRKWLLDGSLKSERTRDGAGVSWRIRRDAVEAFVRERPWLFNWREIEDRRWQGVVRDASLRNGWVSTEDAAETLGCSVRNVQRMLAAEQLAGAFRVGDEWRIPAGAVAEVARMRRLRRVAS